MKITAFDITRFGVWRDLSMPKLSEGLNVFYGPNEAGKTTLLEFLRAELYGFGGERLRYVALPRLRERIEGGTTGAAGREKNPLQDRTLIGRFETLDSPLGGGEMMLHCQNGIFHLRRLYDPARSETDDAVAREVVQLTGLDGQTHGEHLLNLLIGGVDEATFNNVFAIGLDELQRLGTLGDTEAADLLFRLSIGLDRVSLVDVMKELIRSRNRLLDPSGWIAPAATRERSDRMTATNSVDFLLSGGRPGPETNSANAAKRPLILRLFEQREQLLDEIAQAKDALREYAKLLGEKRQSERTSEALERELTDYRREEQLYAIAGRLIPIRDRREAIRTQIEQMEPVVPVPDEAIRSLEQLETDIAARQVGLKTLRDQYARLRKQIDDLHVDESLWRLAPRIDVLLEEESRILEIDRQITRFEQEISAIETELAEKESHIRPGRRRSGDSDPLIRSASRGHGNTAERANRTVYSGNAATDARGTEPDSERKSTTPSRTDSDATRDARPADAARSVPPGTVIPGKRQEGVSLEDFRIPAKSLAQARERFAEIKDVYADLRERTKVLDGKVAGELAARKVDRLADAIEQGGELLNQLRRRQAVGARLGEMLQYRKELERVNQFYMQNQALPLLELGGLYGLAALGIALLGWAVFFKPEYALVGILGLLLAIAAVAVVFYRQNNNKKKLQHNQRQLALLLAQMEQAKKEADAIDSRFPGDGKLTVEVRLQNAQQELAAVEKLLPVEAEWMEAAAQLKEITPRYEQAGRELSESKRRWTAWLRSAGLPEDWSPAQIRDLIGRYDSVGGLRRELDHRYESMNQRIRDMRIITDRIDRMIAETGLTFPDGLSYVDILEQVRTLLAKNEEAIARRDKIQEEIKTLRRDRRKQTAGLDRVARRLELLLNRFDATTATELRDLHARHLAYLELLDKRDAVGREFTAGIGGFAPETEIESLILPEQRERLPHAITLVAKRIDATQTRLNAERETRGRLGERLAQLADDRTTQRKQRELALLDEKIDAAIRMWRTYAVTTYLLDDIRRTYERERQPQTLFEASELLSDLTSGKYVRVWTPMGEETLYIDDDEGNTLDVSWLSRGTREQLFIAIRLALTSAFLKHGTDLPLILDDVLVNFDTTRAVAAAKMLQRVAATGRQVFLFTCHEHICRIFQRLDTAVRILPKAGGTAPTERRIRVLLPISLLKKRQAARRELKRERRRRRDLKLQEEAARRRAELDAAILLVQQQATAEKAGEQPLIPIPSAEPVSGNQLAAPTGPPLASDPQFVDNAESVPGKPESET